jgi:hypothetical protein
LIAWRAEYPRTVKASSESKDLGHTIAAMKNRYARAIKARRHFMSVIYPSINSKGISCFPKSEHGAVAGVILFFTCLSAVVGPLAMGAVSDAMGDTKYGFILTTGFARLLFAGLLLNWMFDPARELLNRLDETEYR